MERGKIFPIHNGSTGPSPGIHGYWGALIEGLTGGFNQIWDPLWGTLFSKEGNPEKGIFSPGYGPVLPLFGPIYIRGESTRRIVERRNFGVHKNLGGGILGKFRGEKKRFKKGDNPFWTRGRGSIWPTQDRGDLENFIQGCDKE